MSALDSQVGGDHYRAGSIQPIQYIEANSLQFLEASVVKRVTRHNRSTGKGRQDIEKAIHELQLLLELRYAATGGPVSGEPVTVMVGEQASDYCLPAVKHPLPMPPVAAPAPLYRQSFASAKQATHRDGGGSLFKEENGRWMQWGLTSWFTASSDPDAVPEGLKPLRGEPALGSLAADAPPLAAPVIHHDGQGCPVADGTMCYFLRHNGHWGGPHAARQFPPGDWSWDKPGTYTIQAYQLA